MPTFTKQMNNLRAFAAQDILTTAEHVDREGCGGVMDSSMERGDGRPKLLLDSNVSGGPDHLIAGVKHLEGLNHLRGHLEKEGSVADIWDTRSPRRVV